MKFPKKKREVLRKEAYEKRKLAVLDRDKWVCRVCGASVNLSVHHMIPRSQARNDCATNLISLCVNCHANVHNHKLRIVRRENTVEFFQRSLDGKDWVKIQTNGKNYDGKNYEIQDNQISR